MSRVNNECTVQFFEKFMFPLLFFAEISFRLVSVACSCGYFCGRAFLFLRPSVFVSVGTFVNFVSAANFR